MSSKGQVVIPEDIRNRMGLRTGNQFVVVGRKDVVILKSIQPPSMDEFDSLIQETRRQARRAGMKPTAISKAIHCARTNSDDGKSCSQSTAERKQKS